MQLWKSTDTLSFSWRDVRYNLLDFFVSTTNCEETKLAISHAIKNNDSRSYNLTDDWSIARRGWDSSLSVNKPQPELAPYQYDNSFIWREYIQQNPEDHKRILDYWLTQVKYRTSVRIFLEIFADIPFAGFIEFLAIIQKSIYKDLDITLQETKSWFL